MPGRRTRPRLHRACKGNDSKRQRLDRDGRSAVVVNLPKTPESYDELPPIVWAKALDFLPMDDVLNCSITSKFFLHQVSPLIRYLLVRTSANLMGQHARKRFSGVSNIFIYTLIEPTEEEPLRPKFCFATSSHLVPFLLSFPKLKFCFVGGYGPKPQTTFKLIEGPVLGMPIPSWDTNNRHPRALFQAVAAFFSWNLEDPYEPIRQAMASYITELCQAYTTGQLKKQVRLYTLPQQRKPVTNEAKTDCIFQKKDANGDTYCPICPLICSSFPPAQILRCWDYEIPCFTVRQRLQRMLDKHSGEDLRPLFQKHLLEELKNKVGVKAATGSNENNNNNNNNSGEVVMTYHQEKLDVMGWLIENGANAHDPKIAHVIKRQGNAGFKGNEKKNNEPRRLDRQVYNRLREWGVSGIRANDFKLVDLPNVRVVQRVD